MAMSDVINLSFNDTVFNLTKKGVCCPCDPADVQFLMDRVNWLVILATIVVAIFVLDVIHSRIIKKKKEVV